MYLVGNERRAIGWMIMSAIIVGVAIALDGPASKAVNAVGGGGWLVSTILIVKCLRSATRPLVSSVAVAGAVAVLATSIRPTDLGAAAVGFGAAGMVVAAVSGGRRILWAGLVPALWLPAHLSIAIARSVFANTQRVRTDPPPTTALVPLTMVLSALAAAAVVEAMSRRRSPITVQSAQPGEA